ncbi:hypothetical protein QM306_35935, partial [Burkholderia cenocepacia]|nr:hypothetical protein [Burkholderia cenocepacia]
MAKAADIAVLAVLAAGESFEGPATDARDSRLPARSSDRYAKRLMHHDNLHSAAPPAALNDPALDARRAT